MGKLIVLTYVLFALVLFTQAQNFAQPDFANIATIVNTLGYAPGSTDQPNGQTYPTQRPHTLKTNQRFDDAKCASVPKDCSIPVMEPNPKLVSSTLGVLQPARFTNARKVNYLHLAFASLVNHDVVRYGSGANASLPLLNWTVPTPDFGVNGWVNNGAGELDGNVTTTYFKVSRNNGPAGTGPGTGKNKNSVHTRPPWFDLDMLYEGGGGTTALGGTVANGTFGWDNNSTSPTKGEFFLNKLNLPVFSSVQAFVWLCPSCPVVLPILVREHNWYAQRLKQQAAAANFTPLQIFNLARRWTIAIWQSIAFYEYAPIIFNDPMPVYDPNNTPGGALSIPQEVIMIAHYPYSEYGVGMSLLDENLEYLGYVPTKGAMSNTAYLTEALGRYTEAAFVRGAIWSVQDNVDLYFTDAMRSVGNAGQFSTDTMARMLGRSREAGINTLNEVRKAFLLDPYPDWPTFFSKTQLTQAQKDALQKLYTNINDLDFWIGGLAEWKEGTHMGETWTSIYKQYWIDIRNADKFWFEGSASGFTDAEKAAIRNTKMSDLIIKHTAVKSVPCSAFFANAADCPSAPPAGCASHGDPNFLEAVPSMLNVNWTDTVAGSGAITFTVSGKTTSGFVALGIPQVAGRMLGADAFITTITNGKTNPTTVYKLGARQPCSTAGVGVCPNTNSPYKVSNSVGTIKDGWTWVTFTVTGPNMTAGALNLIASMGPLQQTTGNPTYHGANKGVGTVTIKAAPPATQAPTCAPVTPAPTSAPSSTTTAAPVKCGAFSLGSSIVLLFITALLML